MSSNSLNSALLIATSGLRAAQAGIDVVSRNVSNSGVEGYTRKQAPVTSLVVGDRGAGVRTQEVIRDVNDTLVGQLNTATSSNERLTVEDDFLGRFEAIFGSPGSDGNISAKLGNLHSAFSALTVSPDNPTTQSQAVAQAQEVVQNLNLMSQNIRSLREEADAKIETSVNTVNTALVQIDDLNRQIQTLQAQFKSTADLEDQRDIQIATVAKEMDIKTSKQTSGAIFVSTSTGRALVDSTFTPTSLPLTFNKTPAILPQTAYYPPPSSSFSGLSGVTLLGTDITSEIAGGHIGGYLNLRDDYLPATQSQIDELGAKVIQTFNDQDIQLFQNGGITLPSDLSVQTAVSPAGANLPDTISLQSLSGTVNLSTLTTGMSIHFGSHNTAYQITGINAVAGTITFAQVGSATGLTQAVAANDTVTFGPAIPQLTVKSSAAVGQGATAATAITTTGLVGATVGMRIQFANHNTVYTVTGVGTAGPNGEQTLVLQPDGGTSTIGLLGAVAAGEAIKVMSPVPGVVGISTNIQLNPNVVNNPWRMRDGTRVQTQSTLTGDNTLPTNIINMLGTIQTFSRNTGLTTSATLENFAAGAVAFEANRRATTQASLSSQSIIYENFKQRAQNDSGVNVDQELAFMLQVQNSYSASARTITAIRDMMDVLLQTVG
jgi:flagellar hook-associated protein 1 FlgK